jgi:hypothetical protein
MQVELLRPVLGAIGGGKVGLKIGGMHDWAKMTSW